MVLITELGVPKAFSSGLAPVSGLDGRFFGRHIVMGAGAHAAMRESWTFAPERAAHELGHALGWSHSYSGDYGETPYDNPIDVMSGSFPRQPALKGQPQSTLAINRYASGGLDEERMQIARDTSAKYQLGPIGSDFTQLVAVPPFPPPVHSSLLR